jgi:hypothetical protein
MCGVKAWLAFAPEAIDGLQPLLRHQAVAQTPSLQAATKLPFFNRPDRCFYLH